jgi:hypothetical protein
MEVSQLYEHDDGSATVVFELTKEESGLMLVNGVRAAIMDGLKQGEKWSDKGKSDLDNPEWRWDVDGKESKAHRSLPE